MSIAPLTDQPSTLPIPRTSLVGRAAELASARTLLLDDAVPLLTLIGPGGVGKTRLALALAHDLAGSFADGASFVDLSPIRDPALVLPTVAQVLGISDAGERLLAEILAAYLRPRQLLLVLDNVEQVLAAAPQVADLLSACPALQILATSRAPLHLRGEHEFPIPPLPLPTTPDAPAAELAQIEAIALLLQRARAAVPTFVPTDDDLRVLAECCRRLDGLPLAIELAAARLKVLSPAALLARLSDRLRLLTGGARDLPDRQRTLSGAIAWSHDLLSSAEQRLFARLAVFAGGCTLEAVEAVATAGVGSGIDTLDGVASLVDKSLLRQEIGADGQTRYGMLETIREFALERLAASGEEDAIRERHAAWYVALAEKAGPDFDAGRDVGRWFGRFDAELPNLRAALAQLTATGGAVGVLRLLGSTDEYWTARPYVSEARASLETALAAAPDAPLAIRATALHLAALLAAYLGDRKVAVARAEEALGVARALGTPFALGRAHDDLATAWDLGGDAARAAVSYAEATPLLREAGQMAYAALALANLGDMRQVLGDAAAAIPLLDEALDVFRGIGYATGIAMVLGQRGYAALLQGDHALAIRLFADSIATARQIGFDRAVLGALAGLAGVALALDQPDRAARLLGGVETAQGALGVGRPAHGLHAERVAAKVRAALGETAFAAAWEEGRHLSYDQALADALAIAPSAAAPQPTAQPARDAFGLSPREREVLSLLAQRQTTPEIAATLFLSPRTVETHVAALFNKLGVSSRREAAALAARHGLA